MIIKIKIFYKIIMIFLIMIAILLIIIKYKGKINKKNKVMNKNIV